MSVPSKPQSGQTANGTNFRSDLTVNGSINASDVGAAKAQSGTSLPTAPAEAPPESQ